MGRIVVTEFMSLDGVIEDPGGSENFRHGGWSFATRSEEGAQFKLDETRSSAALLLGRVTYEGFAEAWPSREGEFADLFNNMPKYVVSSTLQRAEWNNSTVLKGGLAESVAKLKRDQEGDIVVHGSARLVQGLLELDLVDELILHLYPVVVGDGLRLFPERGQTHNLKLVESRSTSSGVTIQTYRPAGRATFGNAGE